MAQRIVEEGVAPVLDVGCGDGALAAELPAGASVVGIDVDGWAGAHVLGDARSLPIRTGSCGAVAALWMLYLLDEPALAIAEARRVLRPGGLFAACTTARGDSPELLEHLPPQPPTSFDAEDAPAIVATAFRDVEVEGWDGPGEHLATPAAIAEHLAARGVDVAFADGLGAPLQLTRRGVLVWARR